MNIILAIHPHHAEAILAGTKTAELRRVLPKNLQKGDTVFLLATGTRHIVGHCTFAGHSVCPAGGHLAAGWLSGIAGAAAVSYDFARDYLRGARTPCALLVRYPMRYAKPMHYIGSIVQSYIYTDMLPTIEHPRVENYRLYCKTHP